MKSVSERLQEQLAIARSQNRESLIVEENGHLVLTTTNGGLSMREQYLLEQGYDIEDILE